MGCERCRYDRRRSTVVRARSVDPGRRLAFSRPILRKTPREVSEREFERIHGSQCVRA